MSKDFWCKFLYVGWGDERASLQKGICAGGSGEVDGRRAQVCAEEAAALGGEESLEQPVSRRGV